MGLLKVGSPCRIIVLLLAIVVVIGTPLGIAGYQRNQEPVGYDPAWWRD